MVREIKAETLEEVANILSVRTKHLKPLLDNGVLYFNSFSSTWFINSEEKLENIEDGEKEK